MREAINQTQPLDSHLHGTSPVAPSPNPYLLPPLLDWPAGQSSAQIFSVALSLRCLALVRVIFFFE
jgi:hypothetical protein